MRLIDADKLIDAMNLYGMYKHENPEAYDTLMKYEILQEIEDQPTAYDVDKVVEYLEATTIDYDACRHHCLSYDWSVGACDGMCEDYAIKMAIDIVRRGGGIE